MMKLSRVISVSLALLAFASTASSQQVFMDHGVRQTILSRSTTATQRVTLTWGSATDGRFSADTYYVNLKALNSEEPWSLSKRQTTTSLVVDIPLRLFVGDSVGLYAKVKASRRGVVGSDSITGMRWYKRRLSPSDIAHTDSFPEANHRMVMCTFYGQRMAADEIAEALAYNLAMKTTLRDSSYERNTWEAIRTGPDSVYTSQDCGADWCMRVGYKYPAAMLLKNRYTGKIRTEDGVKWTSSNPDVVKISQGSADCSKRIADWEAQRDS